jgi:hypothetical protein
MQPLHLLLDMVHHCLQCIHLRGLSLLVEVVHVQVIWDRHLTAGNGLQPMTAAAAAVAAVAAAVAAAAAAADRGTVQ